MTGKPAVGALPGFGKWLLVFDVTAVALTARGQSFMFPRGPGMNDGTPFGGFDSLLAA